MNNKITVIWLLLFTFGSWPWGEPRTGPSGQDKIKLAEYEKFLETASIVSVDKGRVPGRNDPWIVRLNDGKSERRGIFKYIDRAEPAYLRVSYKYEMAAYRLDRLLGLGRVPPAVERVVEGMRGSLQLFLEGCINEKDRRLKKLEPPDSRAFEEDLEEINVFEILTACEPGKLDEILIHTETWQVCRIDFSEAFASSAELINGQEIKRCSRRLYQGLRQLKDAALREKMKPCLGEAEVKGLIGRKKAILDEIGRLIKEKGEAAVLF